MSETPPLSAAIVPVTAFEQNCSLIWSPQTMAGVVIDPGGDVDKIIAAIKETGMKPEAIVLTHGHIDHAGGADELKEKLGINIIGPHKDDEFLLESLAETAKAYGLPPARDCTSDTWLDDGDRLTIGETEFEVLHCPGHSPGSVVFVNSEINLAIVGDVLFAGSIGRTDLPRGNHDQLLTSIREKLLPLDDGMTFICGHGPTSTIGRERKTNPFLQ